MEQQIIEIISLNADGLSGLAKTIESSEKGKLINARQLKLMPEQRIVANIIRIPNVELEETLIMIPERE